MEFNPFEGLTTKRVPGALSKAQTVNPKDLFGAQKVSLTKIPPVALLHEAHAMMNGASKYGAFNWRAKDVQATIYVDAALRHILAWFEGEETADDSGVHHLGHARACLGILLDASEGGNLIDDRPKKSCYPDVLKALNQAIADSSTR